MNIFGWTKQKGSRNTTDRSGIFTGAAALATALLFATACDGGSAAGQSQRAAQPPTAGWKQYRDTQFNFSLSHPAGWTVQVDESRVLVQNPDRSAFVVIQNFVPKSEETAEDHVDALPKTASAILPQCAVKEAYTLDAPAKKAADGSAPAETGEQAVGSLTYTGEQGPGQARVLCLVYPRGGLLFGLAAVNEKFASAQPLMLRILQSFQFTAPTAAQQGRSKESQEGGVPGTGTANRLKFVPWSDTAEQGFSVDVPQGWSTDGGTFRASVLDTRQSILTRSPGGEVTIMLGDAGVPGFMLPSQATRFSGHSEGSVLEIFNHIRYFISHFMPAKEFNQWYLTNFLGKTVNDLQIGEFNDRAEDSRRLTEQSNGQIAPGSGARAIVSIGETRFTCTSKQSGLKISGVLVSNSSCYIGNVQGEGNWTGRPNIYAWVTGDASAEAHQKVAKAVYDHMNRTFDVKPEWVKAEGQKQQEFLRMSARNAAAALEANQRAAERSAVLARANAQSSDERRQKMLGDFHRHIAGKEGQADTFLDYVNDQTTVSGGGQSWKVASGYSHYYQHGASGAIIGTNSASNPGPAFSQLGQQ